MIEGQSLLLYWFLIDDPYPQITDPKWKEHKLNSEVFVAFNVEKNVAVIGGTYYGGEMKKGKFPVITLHFRYFCYPYNKEGKSVEEGGRELSLCLFCGGLVFLLAITGIFSMMNYWLPLQGILSMHCSANVGPKGDSALFFGLSGTGKTTLSADPKRFLIGDDEHGWDDSGIFNFEGGCYAKTINLSEKNEPDIYRAIKPGALLENVWLNDDKSPDYFNKTKTENGRVSYPLFHIKNIEPKNMAGHPENCIFLTCDAFGVLPPVARLSPGQAQYHFLSGYTAKVAGTERGILEPEATFSACFGAAFLTLHPTKYGDLLKKKLEKHGTSTYLVNTGWTGGAYGTGHRMSIQATRACIDAILDGSIKQAKFVKDPVFGFELPTSLPGVPSEVLNPRNAWSDKAAYDKQRAELAKMFIKNYSKYQGPGMTDFSAFGPKL